MTADALGADSVAGFHIVAKLGAGGMGTVYRARQLGLDRDVALKVLTVGGATDARLAQRFRREAMIQSTLDHANLVRVFDAGEDGEQRWIAMELVEGGTLARVIDTRGQLPLAFLAPALLQLATGLAFLHDRGVVHRDLKPENVLLSDAGALKISDFGLARRRDLTAMTGAGAMLGTLAYMSPEAVSGAEVGPPADLYALGLIGYEMATGEPPFQTEEVDEMVASIVGKPVPAPSTKRADLPAELDALIFALLSKDAALRPSAAAACQWLAPVVASAPRGQSMLELVRELVSVVQTPGAAPKRSWRSRGVSATSALGETQPGFAAAPGAVVPAGEPGPASANVPAPGGSDPRLAVAAAPGSGPRPADAPVAARAPGPLVQPPPSGRAATPAADSRRSGALAVAAFALVAAAALAWHALRAPAPDPAVQQAACARQLAALRTLGPELLAAVRSNPKLGEAIQRWTQLRRMLAAIPVSDRSRRAETGDAMQHAAADAEAAATAAVGPLKARSAAAGLAPCPGRGLYRLDRGRGFYCDAHAELAPVALDSPVAPLEASAAELALLLDLLATSPSLAGCVERQRHILAALGAGPDVSIPPGLTLADLTREQPALAFDVDAPGENYAIAGEPDRVLECAAHPSVQRVARAIAAFSPVTPAR